MEYITSTFKVAYDKISNLITDKYTPQVFIEIQSFSKFISLMPNFDLKNSFSLL